MRAAARARKCCVSEGEKMNGGFVRTLPVRALRSERQCFANRPLVITAAKVSEEPKLTDAAA